MKSRAKERTRGFSLALLFSAFLLACAGHPEWSGIPLPQGFRTEAGEDEWQDALVLPEPLTFSEIRDRFDEALPESWIRCPELPDDWTDGLAGNPRWSIWEDRDARRLLVVSRGTEPETDDPTTRIGVIDDEDGWLLHRRGLCEERDRSLYSPFQLLLLRGYAKSARQGAPFEQDAWLSAGPEARGEMVADLMSSGLLLGLGPGAVVRLLGEPDEREGDRLRYRFVSETDPGGRSIGDFSSCPEGRHVLEFDFSLQIPEETHGVFGTGPDCP